MLQNAIIFEQFLKQKGQLEIKGPFPRKLPILQEADYIVGGWKDRRHYDYKVVLNGEEIGIYTEFRERSIIFQQRYEGRIPDYPHEVLLIYVPNNKFTAKEFWERRIDSHTAIPFP